MDVYSLLGEENGTGEVPVIVALPNYMNTTERKIKRID
jgi:hypothetical protein